LGLDYCHGLPQSACHLMEPITTLPMALKKMIFEKTLLGSLIFYFIFLKPFFLAYYAF
jgi:hypothetical protein